MELFLPSTVVKCDEVELFYFNLVEVEQFIPSFFVLLRYSLFNAEVEVEQFVPPFLVLLRHTWFNTERGSRTKGGMNEQNLLSGPT